MSKKVKMALGVAAAIAIPFYAPAIAGSLGMSGVLGSATIGALGGALGANLQGGDWRKGATLGAIGGGYQGYQAAQAAQAGTAAGGAEAAASTPAPTGAPTLPASVTDASGLLTQPTAATTGVPTSPLPGLGGTGAGFTGTSAAASPGLLSGVGEALGGPSVYVPAGIQLGAAYLGQQQAAEAQEQADDYAKQQAAEIERQRQLEANIFARREALSKSLEEQAAATNPEYFGLQSARRMQEAGALATREAEQAAPFYKPGLRMAEKRRGQLATARGTGTAYDVGYGTGVEQKTRLTQGAIEALGSAPRTDYSSLANYYGGQASDAMRGGLDVGRLFGDITGRYEQEQNRRREEERLRKLDEERGVRA